MRTKKFLSVVLSIFFIVSALPIMVSAADGIKIKVSSAECLPGETVVVTVDLINNPGISSLKLKVVYDEVLTLQSVVYSTDMGGYPTPPQTMTSPVTLMWLSPFADYASDGTFATLTFTVSEDATPHSVANVRITYNPDDIYDMTESNIPCFVTNGEIIIGSINGEDDAYITPKEDSRIDYSNKIIFSDSWCETNINNIVNISDSNCVSTETNSIYGFIGTGSTLVLNKNSGTVNYNIIITGDLNGDSVCDVLDVADAHLYASGIKEPSENEILAANDYIEENIDAVDYQNIVNWALS